MTDVLDAQYRETSHSLAAQSGNSLSTIVPDRTADAMVSKLQEWERFKALAIRPDDWMTIPGVQGKYLPAEAVDRIAPAIGLSWEIVSKNEHGDPGVRAVICEQLTYQTKKVEKKGKNGSVYFADVPDVSKPIKTLATLYTVTVRCRDSFGRQIEVEGSFSSLEMTKSDYHARQQALARARRVGSLKLIGGVDADVYEEERGRIDLEKRAAAERASKVPTPGQLYIKAKSLGLATDGPSFRVWVAAKVDNCHEALSDGWQPDVQQREAIAEVLHSL